MYCINKDYNKYFGLLKSQSGDIKFHLDSPKGYSRKIISAQTASVSGERSRALWVLLFKVLTNSALVRTSGFKNKDKYTFLRFGHPCFEHYFI